jgi:hypothetical protein
MITFKNQIYDFKTSYTNKIIHNSVSIVFHIGMALLIIIEKIIFKKNI